MDKHLQAKKYERTDGRSVSLSSHHEGACEFTHTKVYYSNIYDAKFVPENFEYSPNYDVEVEFSTELFKRNYNPFDPVDRTEMMVYTELKDVSAYVVDEDTDARILPSRMEKGSNNRNSREIYFEVPREEGTKLKKIIGYLDNFYNIVHNYIDPEVYSY